jgi:hypothetical protein
MTGADRSQQRTNDSGIESFGGLLDEGQRDRHRARVVRIRSDSTFVCVKQCDVQAPEDGLSIGEAATLTFQHAFERMRLRGIKCRRWQYGLRER